MPKISKAEILLIIMNLSLHTDRIIFNDVIVTSPLYELINNQQELYGLDIMHKFNWIRLIARMFEAMAGNFAYSNDIQLFINVINGSLALYAEDAGILRYSMAVIINAAQQFKNIFSTNGYFLVLPSLMRIYSNNQTNEMITRTVEYVCKQLYILHRKPFLLQMFGSVAPILDRDDKESQFGDASKVNSHLEVNY